MTTTPLLDRLVRDFAATWVTPDNHDTFTQGAGDRVLFFSGDPVRFPEGQDVAVVLPELQRLHPGRLQVGVVPVEHEDTLARRWGSQRWPALVFLRDGRYVDTLPGMHDWLDYVELVAQALAKAPSRAPIALAGPQTAAGCH